MASSLKTNFTCASEKCETTQPPTEQMFEAWGLDPVHPTTAAYNRMAARLIEEMNSSAFHLLEETAGTAAGSQWWQQQPGK